MKEVFVKQAFIQVVLVSFFLVSVIVGLMPLEDYYMQYAVSRGLSEMYSQSGAFFIEGVTWLLLLGSTILLAKSYMKSHRV